MQEKESLMVVRCKLKTPITLDNCPAILGKTCDAEQLTLVTEFSVHTSQPFKILIFFTWFVSPVCRVQRFVSDVQGSAICVKCAGFSNLCQMCRVQ